MQVVRGLFFFQMIPSKRPVLEDGGFIEKSCFFIYEIDVLEEYQNINHFAQRKSSVIDIGMLKSR
jgi:hypothetical protein